MHERLKRRVCKRALNCVNALPMVIKTSEVNDRLLKGKYKDFDQQQNLPFTTSGQRGICSIYFLGGGLLLALPLTDLLKLSTLFYLLFILL